MLHNVPCLQRRRRTSALRWRKHSISAVASPSVLSERRDGQSGEVSEEIVFGSSEAIQAGLRRIHNILHRGS